MAQGLSFKSFAARVPCAETTIAQWALEYPDFSNAKIIGKALERFVWEKIHLNCSATGKGNMTGIIWAQKNKWPDEYKEKNETILTQALTVSGDFKALIANMTSEQMYNLSVAMEQRVAEIGEQHEAKASE